MFVWMNYSSIHLKGQEACSLGFHRPIFQEWLDFLSDIIFIYRLLSHGDAQTVTPHQGAVVIGVETGQFYSIYYSSKHLSGLKLPGCHNEAN